jgi:hypothetical protein
LLSLSGILLRLLSTVDGLVQHHSRNNEQPTKLKVCKSVHHHTIQINQPIRCKNFSSLLLDVYVQLNMFGCPHAHHKELNNCSSNLWFYRGNVVVAVLLVVVRPAGPITSNTPPSRSNSKTRGSYCSCWAPNDRHKDARNTLSCT